MDWWDSLTTSGIKDSFVVILRFIGQCNVIVKIQSLEVSQKEKNKYHMLMHIYGD